MLNWLYLDVMNLSEPTSLKRFNIQLLLLLGIIGAVLVGIGEWMLHYLPEGPGGEVSMLFEVPLARASKGHFLAIYAAPLYFAGYYGVMRIFSDTSYWLSRVLMVIGIYAFAVGGIWISSRYFGAAVFQTTTAPDALAFFSTSYDDHYQSIIWVLRISIALISIIYVYLIWTNKLGLPKWLAAFNPILLLVVVISSLVWFKPLGVHLAPAAMNVTHFVFFGMLLLQYKKLDRPM